MPQTFANLSGKTAVVTGSSKGIGRAIAWEFALGGADVIAHYNQSGDAAQKLCEEIRSLGRRAEVLQADLGKNNSLLSFVDAAWSVFGNVDVWVNNAGVDLLTGEGASLDYTAKLQRLLEVDVHATVVLSKETGRRMKAAGNGCVINIGWDQAERGMEGDSGELFSTSKNAVMGFSRSLALNLAPEVRVNCIAPGWIRTAWGESAGEQWQQRVLRETPLKRWGTPEDIAKLTRFLASPDASYITGQVIYANGGAER